MKVIFLDFDGVIVTGDSIMVEGSVSHNRPDVKAIDQLNRIIAETGAKIVVSSMWRLGAPVSELREHLLRWGCIGVVVDKTPVYWNKHRGFEIGEWLDEWEQHGYEKITNFVIFDDCRDMGELFPYLVQTPFMEGITPELANAAINVLNENPARPRLPKIEESWLSGKLNVLDMPSGLYDRQNGAWYNEEKILADKDMTPEALASLTARLNA